MGDRGVVRGALHTVIIFNLYREMIGQVQGKDANLFSYYSFSCLFSFRDVKLKSKVSTMILKWLLRPFTENIKNFLCLVSFEAIKTQTNISTLVFKYLLQQFYFDLLEPFSSRRCDIVQDLTLRGECENVLSVID